MAFDITKTAQDTLTPEEKTWLDNQLKAASDTAVTTFKTESEDARKKSIPSDYEVKFADGTPLDPKVDGAKIVAHLKAQGFTTEQAKAHLEHLQEISKGLVDRQQQFLADTVKKWGDDVKADKELGGDKLPVTQANIKRAMDRFAPEGSVFRTLVNDSGYGNHPEFVRVFNAIGRAMAEDKTLLGGNATGGGEKGKKSDADVIYGETKAS